jgi:hypothetical protein
MLRRNVHVRPRGPHWVVSIEGEKGSRGIFGSQEEALEAAGPLARRHNDQIVVQVSDAPRERAADRSGSS